MTIVLPIIQIIIAVLLALSILIQGGGSGLGSSFGGSVSNASFRSRRGVEKFLLYLSSFLALAFFISSLVNFLF